MICVNMPTIRLEAFESPAAALKSALDAERTGVGMSYSYVS